MGYSSFSSVRSSCSCFFIASICFSRSVKGAFISSYSSVTIARGLSSGSRFIMMANRFILLINEIRSNRLKAREACSTISNSILKDFYKRRMDKTDMNEYEWQ